MLHHPTHLLTKLDATLQEMESDLLQHSPTILSHESLKRNDCVAPIQTVKDYLPLSPVSNGRDSTSTSALDSIALSPQSSASTQMSSKKGSAESLSAHSLSKSLNAQSLSQSLTAQSVSQSLITESVSHTQQLVSVQSASHSSSVASTDKEPSALVSINQALSQSAPPPPPKLRRLVISDLSILAPQLEKSPRFRSESSPVRLSRRATRSPQENLFRNSMTEKRSSLVIKPPPKRSSIISRNSMTERSSLVIKSPTTPQNRSSIISQYSSKRSSKIAASPPLILSPVPTLHKSASNKALKTLGVPLEASQPMLTLQESDESLTASIDRVAALSKESSLKAIKRSSRVFKILGEAGSRLSSSSSPHSLSLKSSSDSLGDQFRDRAESPVIQPKTSKKDKRSSLFVTSKSDKRSSLLPTSKADKRSSIAVLRDFASSPLSFLKRSASKTKLKNTAGERPVSMSTFIAPRKSSLTLPYSSQLQQHSNLNEYEDLTVAETGSMRKFVSGYLGIANAPPHNISFFVLTTEGLFQFRSHEDNQKAVSKVTVDQDTRMVVEDGNMHILRLVNGDSTTFLTCPEKSDLDIWKRGLENAINLDLFTHLPTPPTPANMENVEFQGNVEALMLMIGKLVPEPSNETMGFRESIQSVAKPSTESFPPSVVSAISILSLLSKQKVKNHL